VTERSGTFWRVRSPEGADFLIPDRPGLAAGMTVRFAVRPEWMDLDAPDAAPSGANAVPGAVDDIIYQGEMIRVLVRRPHGDRLTVGLRNPGQLTRPLGWSRGDAVTVHWRPEDCQTLEEA
jgi:ABC-type Fe3+/spermidine/putrescine transport system ATPase subunit